MYLPTSELWEIPDFTRVSCKSASISGVWEIHKDPGDSLKIKDSWQNGNVMYFQDHVYILNIS